VDGRCPDCGGEVHYAKEEAYFFDMGKYQKRLESYIDSHPEFIIPESRKNEMVNTFLKPGLKDLCVSRTSFSWGIPVDFDPGHVVYVWIDALFNYTTFLGYDVDGNHEEGYKKYWPADAHIIGKDILRFHTIYWPIFLMALGVELPKTVFGHPWLLVGEGKMSKSKGNVVYADELIAAYGLDEVRYFLLREMPYGADGVFTHELMCERINSDLVNIFGNLISRTFAMAKQYFGSLVPPAGPEEGTDAELREAMAIAPEEASRLIGEYRAADALAAIFALMRRSNKYIDETMPWVLAKDPDKRARLGAVLYNLFDAIRIASALLGPFMPDTAEKILSALSTKATAWDELVPGRLEEGLALSSLDKLFERVYITDEGTIAHGNPPKTPKAAKPEAARQDAELSIEEFYRSVLKVGQILTASRVEGADKLLVFTVDIGEASPRQIVSGIAEYFSPDSLVGKKAIVVANLKAAKIRGVESQGMFLLAEGGGGLSFLSPEDPNMPVGSIVK